MASDPTDSGPTEALHTPTNIATINDNSGDEYYEELDAKFPVPELMATCVAIAVFLAIAIFYVLYMKDRRRKQKEAKLQAEGGVDVEAGKQLDKVSMERDLVVKTWGDSSSVQDVTEESTEEDEDEMEQHGNCPICSQDFVAGDVVCQSHNPKCLHVFHKEPCLSNWVEYQNRCPVCSQTYLVKA